VNAQGVLVANIAMGSGLELEPLKTAALSRVTGIPRMEDGRTLLTDETTKVTMELAGQALEKELGNRISVTGAIDPASRHGSQVMRVTQIARLMQNPPKSGNTSSNGGVASSDSAAGDGKDDSRDRKKGVAVPAGVGGAAGAAAAGGILGMSMTTVAIVGGVAAAATMGGLAAANKLPGQSSTASTASR
jgi:hypothetical protein